MIVLDLEWNRSYDNIPLEEILQIGAVRLDRLGGRITDTFNIYIRPQVHKKFNRSAKTLPELPESVRSKTSFPAALKAFLDWCGEETVFAGWGGDDFLVLAQNCAYWHLPLPQIHRQLDLQSAFSLMLGTGQRVALHWAVEYCRIPAPFTFHNALHDAVYTAAVGERISDSYLTMAGLPLRLQRFARAKYPPQPRRRVGPFPSPAAALDSRECRQTLCPLCGQSGWIRQWFYADPRQYFSEFRCPIHGPFLWRLTLAPAGEESWQGRLTVPVITPAALQAYQAALEGHTYNCKGHRRRPKRRRPSRRKRGLRRGAAPGPGASPSAPEHP